MTVSPIITPQALSGWWGRSAETVVEGRTATAALWEFRADAPIEIVSKADSATHILSVHTRAFPHETFFDGRFVYGGRTKAGTTNLVLAGQAPRAILNDGFGCLHIYLPQNLVTSFACAEMDCDRDIELLDPRCAFDPQLWRIAQALIGSMQEIGVQSRLGFDSLVHAIVFHLLAHWSTIGESATSRIEQRKNKLAAWQLSRVRDLVAVRLSDNIPMQELADAARLSPFHFARCFKQTTGESPHRYLISMRLERAKELLHRGNLPITDVAASVGYDDPAYLARLFKQRVGVSPMEYRRRSRQ